MAGFAGEFIASCAEAIDRLNSARTVVLFEVDRAERTGDVVTLEVCDQAWGYLTGAARALERRLHAAAESGKLSPATRLRQGPGGVRPTARPEDVA